MSRKRCATVAAVITVIFVSLCSGELRADEPSFTRQEDVIYGRKYGTALTMDVFRPKSGANGAAIVWVVSGGFVSSHENINATVAKPLLQRGYTVFAVVHGSQPRFQIPEIVQDVERSVRFIRHHAKDYGIDPNRLGVAGASAGGHLSLMLGGASNHGVPNAKDPVDKESSRVQAVACFFPPSDFLNWGSPSDERIHAIDHKAPFRPSFDYHERDAKTNLWERITDEQKLRYIARDISPIYRAGSDYPPTLIVHGDKDDLVPLQQAEIFIAKLKEVGVDCKLVVKTGAGHGWPNMVKDLEQLADWFDGHLGKSSSSQKNKSSGSGYFEKEIRAFEDKDQTDPPPKDALLFVGSSSIRLWDLKKSFPGLEVINRGFGGSQLSDSVYYAQRIVTKHQPRLVVLYAGDNDLAIGKKPEQIAADFRCFVGLIHKELPKTRIVFISIKPSPARWNLWEKMQQANQLIEAICKEDHRLIYVDLGKMLLGEDGNPKKDLFRADGLHLNEQGYRAWSTALRPVLQESHQIRKAG